MSCESLVILDASIPGLSFVLFVDVLGVFFYMKSLDELSFGGSPGLRQA
jgi:hypothetical protein